MTESNDPYANREQTEAKHYVLKHYLQALAFKVLSFSDLTDIDGFSGPWATATTDYSDASFKIAIEVLREAQLNFRGRGIRRNLKCFFCERDSEAFERLVKAVSKDHLPKDGFDIRTHKGDFINAIGEANKFVGDSFALTFIDPTGWTGYPLDKVRPLLLGRKREVLVNFMHIFINRAAAMSDPQTISTLDPILGGPNWEDRLDKNLPRGLAVEKLFRETLKEIGNFDRVVSTPIPTANRIHFYLTHGTKHIAGLRAFRNVEYKTKKRQAVSGASAKERKRKTKSGMPDLFAEHETNVRLQSVDRGVAEERLHAEEFLVAHLKSSGEATYANISAQILERFPLRQTDLHTMCNRLAKRNVIENSWGGGNKVPRDTDKLRLAGNE